MTTHIVQGPASITVFCDKRLNPVESNKIIQEYRSVGLSNLRALDDALAQVDYIKVLSHVWAERDRGVRLTWLRKKEGEMHAPLMYELALAEFTAAPTVETVINVSYPLIKAATLRVFQDAACSKDLSVKNGDMTMRLQATYVQALNNRTKEVLNQTLDEIKNAHTVEWNTAFKNKGIQTLQATIDKALPNPQWVDSHGLGKFLGERYAYDIDECTNVRNAFARTNIVNFAS